MGGWRVGEQGGKDVSITNLDKVNNQSLADLSTVLTPASDEGIDEFQRKTIIKENTPNPISLAEKEQLRLEQEANSSKDVKNEEAFSLGGLLLERKLISKDQLEVALKHQRNSEKREDLGVILVNMGFITETALASVLSEQSGIETFDFRGAALDPILIRKIPKDIAARDKIIPIELTKNELKIATTDIYNIIAFDQIRRYFPKNTVIKPVYAHEIQIVDAISQYYEYEMSVDGILREIEAMYANSQIISGEDDSYINPTVRLVDSILYDAIKLGASDLHFEPENDFVRLRYRIDGKLRQILTFHKDYWPPIVVRLKIMSGMNIAENRNPQDGRISYPVMGRIVDFRVATQPTIHGENLVARVLDRNKSLIKLDELGMSEHNLSIIKKLIRRPEGVIIVTGPTGSGKTTTLYSILSHINSMEINIMTLEEPVEYQISLIRQSGVKEGSGLSFAEGIRSMMRQDPDIIFVGEVRDFDTAQMAVRAAMTGHQVFTTLHTNDAIGSIPRLMDLGLPGGILAGSIIGCIAQRLARRLCKFCKEEYYPNEEECRILGAEFIGNPPKLYKHKGCDECFNTGYRGRIAIHEILSITEEIDDIISRSGSRKEIYNAACANGFISMVDDGIKKVLAGITDLEELIDTVNMTERL
jgi:general secretion pathway protein E/type IV pilus assembly protein PilB